MSVSRGIERLTRQVPKVRKGTLLKEGTIYTITLHHEKNIVFAGVCKKI